MKFYLMGNGRLIAEANRGTIKSAILRLQEEDWVKKQGGICQIVEYAEPHAIYFALRVEEA